MSQRVLAKEITVGRSDNDCPAGRPRQQGGSAPVLAPEPPRPDGAQPGVEVRVGGRDNRTGADKTGLELRGRGRLEVLDNS